MASNSDDSSSSEAVTGTITVSDATPDDIDDLHIAVKLDKASGDAAADAAALQAAKGLKQPLEQALLEFYSELKTK